MRKEARSGNGPGLQGPFRAPTMSDLDIEEADSIPASELFHSPVATDKRSLAQIKEEVLQCLPSPKKPSTPTLILTAISSNPLSMGLGQLLKSQFGHLRRPGL